MTIEPTPQILEIIGKIQRECSYIEYYSNKNDKVFGLSLRFIREDLKELENIITSGTP